MIAETLIQEAIATQTAPSAALAVYVEGRLVLQRAYGCLEPETCPQPIHSGTRFDLASVTKLFTATAFLMQVAEGRVRLDDPVVSVIPEFGSHGPRPIEGGQDPHTLERLPPDTQARGPVDPATVTFRHLLTHTGGLAPWRDLFLHTGPPPPPPGHPDPVPRQERVARALGLIASYPFVDVPGRTVRYSDLGLILLGEAVARLEGVPTPAEAIHRRVLDPLGLERTTFNPPEPGLCPPTEFDARWRGRRCWGEVHDENAASLGGIAGHAGLFGPAGEVARFGLQWLRAVQGRAADWLPTEIARQAVQSQADGRGLGWVLKTPPPAYSSAGALFSPQSFGHTGFTGTSLWIDPRRELVVALLTNRVYYGRDPQAITALRPAVHDAICRWVDSR